MTNSQVPNLDQQNKTTQEPTVSSPQTQSGEEIQAAINLSDDQKKDILEVRRRYKQKWSQIRRDRIRKMSKNLEYIKGNQYLIWDPLTTRWYSPFDMGASGSEQGTDDWGFYKYVSNIVQWLELVFKAALTGEVPKTRAWPNDADSVEDMTAAEEASKAQAKIERDNNIAALMDQALTYIFAGGCYFRYTRWLRDADRAGVHQEPVITEGQIEIFPDRYVCPKCGADVPAQGVAPGTQPTCPDCGTPLTDSDFYPAEHGTGPVVAAMKDVPNGMVAQSILGTLNIDCDPRSGEPNMDPLQNSPLLDYEDEADVAVLRAIYPGAWDKIKQAYGTGDSGQAADFARTARAKVYASTLGRTLTGNEMLPTLSRCWIQPWAFNILDDQEKAKALQALFPDSCFVTSVGPEVLDIRNAKLTDSWTWCGAKKGFGCYPPAPCDYAIDFQDRINDAANDVHQYMDRLAVPDVLVNTNLIDHKAINSLSAGAGGYKPVKPKVAMNGQVQQGLESAFFQPKFSADANLYSYGDKLWFFVQTLLGITPQMYGTGQEHIDTASGQSQALSTARGILATYWNQMRLECASASKVGVKCLAQNATEDTLRNVLQDGAGFKNEYIRVDALKGNFNWFPETDQGYPTTFAERQDIIKDMVMNAAKNPIIQEFLQPRTNQRLVAMHIAPSGFIIPGTAEEDKVKKDIDALLQGQPVLMGGVPMPSVQPDKDCDDLDTSEQVVKDFMEKAYYSVRLENPQGFENVRLYLRLVSQFKAQKAAQAQMTGVPPVTPEAGVEQA